MEIGTSGDLQTTKYIKTVWTKDDAVSVQADFTSPKHQATWEIFMLLIALCTWMGELGDDCNLEVRGDAQGILQNIVKGRAKSPAINLIVAEAQLVLAPKCQDLTAIHWWSEHNHICDRLSRPDKHPEVPQELKECQQADCVRRPWRFLRPDVRRELGHKCMDA